MKLINPILFALAALGLTQGAAAVQPIEMDNAIVIEAEDPLAADQLVVTGRNFDNGQTIQLTLGGTPLTVLEHTSTVILAEIPPEVLPGSYVLVAWSGGGSAREDSMDVTIGAEGPVGSEGPEGPQGEQGPTGPQGEQGIRGEQGLAGSDGRDGTSCTVLDQADGATITCTDGTMASVADGAPGTQGVQGDPGSSGVPGRDGKPGADGLSCWDLNNNGVFDEAQEDIDLDRRATALDCRGRDGQEGEQGPAGVQGPPGPGLDSLRVAVFSPSITSGFSRSTSENLRNDMIRLCADDDGCTVRLISVAPNISDQLDSAGSWFLHIRRGSLGGDKWLINGVRGETDNGVVESLASSRSCRLQDSFTEPDGPTNVTGSDDNPWLDNGVSAFELVNLSQPRGTECRLYITD